MWRDRQPAQGGGDARSTARRSISTPRGRRRRTTGCSRHVEATGATFVHPFDDPVLQAGHGTVGLEIDEDVPGVDVVVVPVGGGGLISGIATAVGLRASSASSRRERRR